MTKGDEMSQELRSSHMTLEQKFDAVKNISPAWNRVTHFSWNDLIGMRDQIAQLERTNAALLGALKDAEHLCKWLLQSDIPQDDRERVIRENGINFDAAIAEAETQKEQL